MSYHGLQILPRGTEVLEGVTQESTSLSDSRNWGDPQKRPGRKFIRILGQRTVPWDLIALMYHNYTQLPKRLVVFTHFSSPRYPLGGTGCSNGPEEGHLLTAPLENETPLGSPSCRSPSKITWGLLPWPGGQCDEAGGTHREQHEHSLLPLR